MKQARKASGGELTGYGRASREAKRLHIYALGLCEPTHDQTLSIERQPARGMARGARHAGERDKRKSAVSSHKPKERLSGHSATPDGQARRLGTVNRDHKTAPLCPHSLLIDLCEQTAQMQTTGIGLLDFVQAISDMRKHEVRSYARQFSVGVPRASAGRT